MNNNGLNEIDENLLSSSPFRIINGIIAGTRAKRIDNFFIMKLRENAKNNEVVLHVPVSSFALAALDILGIEEYSGNEDNTLNLIKNEMNF